MCPFSLEPRNEFPVTSTNSSYSSWSGLTMSMRRHLLYPVSGRTLELGLGSVGCLKKRIAGVPFSMVITMPWSTPISSAIQDVFMSGWEGCLRMNLPEGLTELGEKQWYQFCVNGIYCDSRTVRGPRHKFWGHSSSSPSAAALNQ